MSFFRMDKVNYNYYMFSIIIPSDYDIVIVLSKHLKSTTFPTY